MLECSIGSEFSNNPPQPPHGMERASLLKNYAWVIVFFYSSSNTLPNSVSLSPICKAENVSVKFGKKLVVDTDRSVKEMF